MQMTSQILRTGVRRWLLLVALGIFALAPVGHADVLFTNFAQSQGAPFGGSQVGLAVMVANSTLNITSVVLKQSSGPTAGETLGVYSQNASDGKIGTLLFQDFALSHDDNSGLETATPNSPLVLLPNTAYWFAMNTTTQFDVTLDATGDGGFTPTSFFSWATPFAVTVTDSTGTGYGSAAVGPPLVLLNGTAVPEPTALSVLGLTALMGMLTSRLRRSA
jgi:hypothetical protein